MARIRDPSAYSGCWGPGTLVIVRLNSRVAYIDRASVLCRIGGARPLTSIRVAAPSASSPDFSDSVSLTWAR